MPAPISRTVRKLTDTDAAAIAPAAGGHDKGRSDARAQNTGPHLPADAIVPAELVERYEAMSDIEDGRIALKRLADLDAGRTKAVPANEVARTLGL